jgi:hypothetical protein
MPSDGSRPAASMGDAEGPPPRSPEDDPRHTPFLAILAYVLGFMGALAFLAWILARLLRHG